MPVAELQVVDPELAGAFEHVVVDIGQVLDVDDLVAEVLQVPMQDVEAQVGEGMPQVARVIRRHAADVEADRPVADRREGQLLRRAGCRTGAGTSLGILERARVGWTDRRRIAAPRGDGQLPRGAEERAMEVLRWFAVFVLAMLLIVAGLFWLMGRPLPIPLLTRSGHHSVGLVLIRKPMTPVAAAMPYAT